MVYWTGELRQYLLFPLDAVVGQWLGVMLVRATQGEIAPHAISVT